VCVLHPRMESKLIGLALVELRVFPLGGLSWSTSSSTSTHVPLPIDHFPFSFDVLALLFLHGN
jgi:hypothetical protein